MQDRLISVIMPVYNAEKYVGKAIESILRQTYSNFEFLILNDGSTDRSAEIIKTFQDKRIRFFDFQQNTGLVSQLNNGIAYARGEYLARMDADDIALPNRLADQSDFMNTHTGVGLCGCFVIAFDQKKKYFKSLLPRDHDEICAYLLFGSPFFHPAIMIRRSVLIENNLQYTKGVDSSEDYYLYVDLHNKTKFANLSTPGLLYRLHETNMSKTHGAFQRMAGQLKRREYVSEFIGERDGAKDLVEKHFFLCTRAISSVADFKELMNWLKYLSEINANKNLYHRQSFLTGISHFIYRHLISNKMTDLGTMSRWIIHYPEFFFALPAMYKFLFSVRCFRDSLITTFKR